MILPGDYVVRETRVSPHQNVTLVVTDPAGRTATVHLPRGTDTPEAITTLVKARFDDPVIRGRNR